MGVYNYSYSKELNDALTLWDDYCKGNITIHQYHPLSSAAELKVKSNQKYSNFDLATWEPWMQYGLKWAYNQDTHRYPHKKNFINIVNKDFTGFYTAQDPEIEGFVYDLDEDIQSGKLVPGTTPLSTWNGCGCDDTWYDVTKVFPKDYSVYCYVAPDEDQISFRCYDVTIIVDNATDEIVWMTTHSD